MDVFQKVALLLPEHRKTDRRRSHSHLDDLLDDYRKIGDFEAWGLDLLLMSYRLHAAFETALREFRPSGVNPPLLRDYLAMGFAARLTRDHSRLLSQLVESIGVTLGTHLKGVSNAFFRFADRQATTWLEHWKSHPEELLPQALQKRWSSHPWIQKQAGQRLIHRPDPGVEGFGREAIHKRQPLSQWQSEAPFQTIQAASWNWVSFILQSGPTPKSILDACAAPGSKLIALLTRLNGFQGRVTACDASPKRLPRLKDNLERWGLAADVKQHNWTEPLRLTPVDWILADLPCTGLGTLHTRPDLVVAESWNRLPDLQKQQEQILKSLMTYTGAKLFVSLCSVDPEEIEFVSTVLRKTPDFHSWKLPTSTLMDEGVVGWIYG